MFKTQSISVIIILAAAVALGPLATDMYLPSLPGLTAIFDTTIDRVQVTLSVYLYGFAFAQLVYGPLADRFGRKPVLLGGLILFILGSIGCVMSTSIDELILFRFLQALGACGGQVLGRTMVRDIHGPANAAKALSMMGSIMALAPVVAPIIGGWMIIWFEWTSTFIFLTSYAIITLLIITFKVPESLAVENRNSLHPWIILKNFGILIKHPVFMGYTLSCSFIFSGLFAFLSGAPFVIIDYFGFPAEHSGIFYAIASCGFLTGTIIAQRIGTKVGINGVIKRGTLFSLVAGVTMLLPALFDLHNLWLTVLTQVIFMIGVGMVMPQAMAGALIPFPNITGTASSLLGFTQSVIAASTGMLVGHFHNGTPTTMAVAIAAMGALAMLSFILLVRPAKAAT